MVLVGYAIAFSPPYALKFVIKGRKYTTLGTHADGLRKMKDAVHKALG